MSDRAFQWALTTMTILVLVWIVAGIALRLLPFLGVVLSAVVIEAVAAIVLLRYWGGDYMGRRS